MVFLPASIKGAARHDMRLHQLLSSVTAFAKMHRVQDKESKREIPFNPLPMQEKIFDAVEAGHKKIAVIKARQVAATTAAKMVVHHRATTTDTASMHAIISLRADSAEALLDDNRRWLEHPPAVLKRKLKSKRKGEISYADTGASIKAFTSRSTTGLRSFAPSTVLISEFAFAPDQEELLAQATAAVGDGLLIIESTANNPGDAFSRIITGGESGFHIITMWWWEHPSYKDTDLPSDFVLSESEQKLADFYTLSPNQVSWRRRQVALLGEIKFRREYPSCIDDCFLNREGGYFSEEEMAEVQVLDFALHGEDAGREIEPPEHNDRYVMGVDVSNGVGADWSTLAVVSVATRQPVFTMRSRTTTPKAWAHKVIQVASRYNMALVLVEAWPGPGAVTVSEMDSCGYRNMWRHPSTGKVWSTNLHSKLEAFDTLREAVKLIRVIDRVSWMELRSLTVPAGKMAPEAPDGAHDDSAVAMALAYRALNDVPPSWRMEAVVSRKSRVDVLLDRARARRIRSSALPF